MLVMLREAPVAGTRKPPQQVRRINAADGKGSHHSPGHPPTAGNPVTVPGGVNKHGHPRGQPTATSGAITLTVDTAGTL